MTPASGAAARPLAGRFSYGGRLGVILAVSYALRLVLAFSGGEGFWPDESRYGEAAEAAYRLAHHQWRAAADELVRHADHVLFRWVSLPIALVEQATGAHPALVAAYFALFSVGVIALVGAIARRAGAGESEALWAAGLAACSNVLFYYSRHFFPYDASLCAVLLALWLALGSHSAGRSLLTGALAGAAFLIYNGYWLPAGSVLILHVLLGDGGRRRLAARAAGSAAGLALALGGVLGLAALLGHDLLGSSRQFAGTVTQGDWHQGYRVIGGYLWSAEGGVLLIWLAAFAYALGAAPRPRRLLWYGGGAVLIAAGLVFFSDVVPKFVVYGRSVRALVPFLCLGAAAGLERLTRQGSRAVSWAAALLLLGLALANFRGPLRQVFPDGFFRLAAREVVRRSGEGYGVYRTVFAERLWGVRLDGPVPDYPELLRRPHPLQFRPYQYEGYSAAQRAELNRLDVAMRLLKLPAHLDASAGLWGGYPGPVRLEVSFPSDCAGDSEPLVTAGQTGRGDILFVRYLDGGHVAFGLDHWGGGAVLSAPVALDYRRVHDLVLSLGSLLPPPSAGLDAKFPELDGWRNQLLVMLDGQVVFFRPQEFHPSTPANILFGINLIGGTVVRPSFSGTVRTLDAVPAEAIRAAVAGFGPLRLLLQLPPGATGRRQPLVVLGIPGRADLLSIEYLDASHVRFGFDHWSSSFVESGAVPVDYGRSHELEIRLPTLGWPAPPDGGRFQGDIVILLDGAVAWRTREEFYRCPRDQLAIGANRIGGSTCEPAFTGRILNLAWLANPGP